MTLNARQKSYLNSLQNRYFGAVAVRKETRGLSTSHRLVVALEIIERANRPFVRRMGEYAFFALNILFHKLLRVPLLNVSIGIYQLKVAHILDLLDIQYQKRGKQLVVHPRTSLSALLSILVLANKAQTVDFVLSRKFHAFDWDRLTDSQLRQVAAFYSGSASFGRGLDYFYVLRQLYSVSSARQVP